MLTDHSIGCDHPEKLARRLDGRGGSPAVRQIDAAVISYHPLVTEPLEDRIEDGSAPSGHFFRELSAIFIYTLDGGVTFDDINFSALSPDAMNFTEKSGEISVGNGTGSVDGDGHLLIALDLDAGKCPVPLADLVHCADDTRPAAAVGEKTDDPFPAYLGLASFDHGIDQGLERTRHVSPYF